MLTSVWGPSLWHTLHTISFNYPVKPTKKDKEDNYKRFILSLKHVLPCKYCGLNFKNLKDVPLNDKALKNRANFSRWMYNMHEHINKMLGKNQD